MRVGLLDKSCPHHFFYSLSFSLPLPLTQRLPLRGCRGSMSSARAASLAAAVLLGRRRRPLSSLGGCEWALPSASAASLMGWPSRCRHFSSSSLITRASLGDNAGPEVNSRTSGCCGGSGGGNSELSPQKNRALLIQSAAAVAATRIPKPKNLPSFSFSTSSSTSSTSFSADTPHDPIAIPTHPCHQASALALAEAEAAMAKAALLLAEKETEAGAGAAAAAPPCSSKPKVVKWQDGGVPLEAKEQILNQKACVIWLTGLPASGKSAVAVALERQLGRRNRATALLDGDNVRHGLCADLGFSPEDRAENVRRVGEAARILSTGGGLLTIAALVSPYRAHRDAVRASLPPGRFVEVLVDAPLELCERRDPKGLYAAARAGKLHGLTGLDAPYEKPESPEVVVSPCDATGGPEAAAAEVVRFLKGQGLIPRE